jgi:hypothetical protein
MLTAEGWADVRGVNLIIGPSATATRARPVFYRGHHEQARAPRFGVGVFHREVVDFAVPGFVTNHCVGNLVGGLSGSVVLLDVLLDDLARRPVVDWGSEQPDLAVHLVERQSDAVVFFGDVGSRQVGDPSSEPGTPRSAVSPDAGPSGLSHH